jgi:hypothetical protein
MDEQEVERDVMRIVLPYQPALPINRLEQNLPMR